MTFHVATAGDRKNPAVVLCQGLGMRIEDWPNGLILGLAEMCFVVMIDNRDAGRSAKSRTPYTLFDMADDICAVVDDLRLSKFAVLGFSMGGMIGQIIAGQHPERVTSFIQICSSAGEARAPFPEEARARFECTATGFVSDAAAIAWLAEDIRYFAAPADLTPDQATKKATEMVQAGFSSDAFGRQLAAIDRSGDRAALLRAIRARTLIISGEEDRCIPLESSVRAAKLIPGAQHIILRGMGHTVTGICVSTILAWARDHIAERSAVTQ